MNIGGIEIGPDQPCRIVAEISNNHNGSPSLALRLIREAADAGADFVKFQCYTPAELVALRGDGPAPDPWGADGWTMRQLYEKAQTPHSWFPAMVEECNRVGVPWFSSVFGVESLALLNRLDCPAYKIAALDVHTTFAKVMSRKTQPVIASSRGAVVEWADLTLYCPPGYPQDAFDWHVLERCEGLSYHGTDPAVGLLAAELGAAMVEVHVQLDDMPSELESDVSLTISQLRELCGA